MSFSLKIEVAADSATPALEHLVDSTTPRRVAEKLHDPLLNLVRHHYETLPPNKNHWPSTGFWKKASDSTYADDENGVTITTSQIGVRQRLLGGDINAYRAKNISIPNVAEAYGKLPGEFPDLVVVPFGRGQDAPKALVRAADVDFVRRTSSAKAAGSKILFWLRPSVYQEPDPNVLPSEDEIFSVIDETLRTL